MKTLRTRRPSAAAPSRRGAALMMAFWILLILILIVAQISRSTNTAARVGRNEEVLMAMNQAIESVLLQVHEDLGSDGEAAAAGGAAAGLPAGLTGGGGGGAGGIAGGGGAEGGGGGGEGEGASDSREDEWARPQRTELNGIRLRILIQDEDSKLNVLSILTENEDEAEKAFERLVRVIDFARGGTDHDIDGGDARRMAEEIREYLTRRRDQVLPKPILLTDDEEDEDRGTLLSVRELVALDSFEEDHFRDFRDERGDAVHSLASFLTVWSSLATFSEFESGNVPGAAQPTPAQSAQDGGDGGDDEGDAGEDGEGEAEGGDDPVGGLPGDGDGGEGDGAPGAPGDPGAGSGGSSGEPGGGAINLNTAPPAVLKALFDDRDVPYRFWDEVIEYRNTEDEEVEENEDPPLDEYGEEITVNQFFDSLTELSEIGSWNDLDPLTQTEVTNLLTAQSQVFSIYVTARRPTGLEADAPPPLDKRDLLEQEEAGQGLVRTVRSVVWRRASGDGEVELIPIERWEVLDYVPIEVVDYPEDRYASRDRR